MAEIEIPNPEELHEKAENPFTRHVALFVAVFAVGLAVASFGGQNAAKEMMMAKQEEANQWNRYQSKATREALYKNEIRKLKMEKRLAGNQWPQERESLLQEYEAEAARMERDKKEIELGGEENGGKGAKHYQDEVKKMQRKDPYFDFAEVAFQVAIVLASVAMLAGKKWAFYTSLSLAVIGALLTANGFGLFVAVPGFEG